MSAIRRSVGVDSTERAASVGAGQAMRGAAAADAAARARDAKTLTAVATYRADTAKVSTAAKEASVAARAFDTVKVDELRDALESGELQPSSQQIAARLLEDD